MVDVGAVTPDQLCEIEREGIFGCRVVGALGACAFNAPAVEENLSGCAEEVARADAFDDGRPALVIKRDTIQLEAGVTSHLYSTGAFAAIAAQGLLQLYVMLLAAFGLKVAREQAPHGVAKQADGRLDDGLTVAFDIPGDTRSTG